MKLSRKRLKQIITEEIERVEEIKNDAVQIATMQDQMNKINGGEDVQILQHLYELSQDMLHLITGLDDKSMQGALNEQIQRILVLVDELLVDVEEREVELPDQHTGGIPQPPPEPATHEENN